MCSLKRRQLRQHKLCSPFLAGKVDDRELRERIRLEQKRRTPSGIIAAFLRSNPQLCHRNDESTTVASLGFSSRDLFEFLFECTTTDGGDAEKERDSLGRRLFDAKTPLGELFDVLERCDRAATVAAESSQGSVTSTAAAASTSSGGLDYTRLETRLQCSLGAPTLRWRQKMRQCVDGGATAYEKFVIFWRLICLQFSSTCSRILLVGDMSGFFVVFALRDGKTLFAYQHRAAILCAPAVCNSTAAFASVDGCIFLVSLDEQIHLTHTIQLGDSIRCSPIVDADAAQIYAATFADSISLVDVRNGDVKRVCALDEDAATIRNAPLLHPRYAIVCTILGLVVAFRRTTVSVDTKANVRRRAMFAVAMPMATKFAHGGFCCAVFCCRRP